MIEDAGADALAMLETMRLGVVPSSHPSAYTVGRERELELVRQDLERVEVEGGAVRTFLGDYGTGKTHMLELVRHAANEKGYLTARVVLNPEEAAPSHPKRVYRALMSSLTYPDRPHGSSEGLRPLLERALQSEDALQALGAHGPRLAHRDPVNRHLYLETALRYAQAIEHAQGKEDEDTEDLAYAKQRLCEWIEGHPTHLTGSVDRELATIVGRHGRVYAMKDYRPWARIYGYLLTGVATLARELGYRGLVALVDEAEFYALLSTQNKKFARTLFKALSFAAIGPHAVPFEPRDLDLGGYGILKQLPPRFGESPGLYVVSAMTPNAEGMDVVESAFPHSSVVELSPFRRPEYTELVSRVLAFYEHARPDMSLPAGLLDALTMVVGGLQESGIVENPRHAMKFVIDFLDIAHFRPSAIPQVITEIREGARAW